jgi:4a-hydroxytetrahydrobiopterin dehydratase
MVGLLKPTSQEAEIQSAGNQASDVARFNPSTPPSQLPDWALKDEARRIERTYRFGNFREALAFVDQVGALAEAEGHHPDVCFGWGYATISLQTHKIKGLHENDFILAAKVDQLAASLV